jgi:hypothetical protein
MTVTPPDGKAQRSISGKRRGVDQARQRHGIQVPCDAGRREALDAGRGGDFQGGDRFGPDQALGEVEVKTGAPAAASKTNPVFKIAVTKVTAAPNPAEKK